MGNKEIQLQKNAIANREYINSLIFKLNENKRELRKCKLVIEKLKELAEFTAKKSDVSNAYIGHAKDNLGIIHFSTMAILKEIKGIMNE